MRSADDRVATAGTAFAQNARPLLSTQARRLAQHNASAGDRCGRDGVTALAYEHTFSGSSGVIGRYATDLPFAVAINRLASDSSRTSTLSTSERSIDSAAAFHSAGIQYWSSAVSSSARHVESLIPIGK